MTQLAAGLGLIRDVVIDQHFGQRNRYGRLLMLVAQSPGLLGIGVDEDTGAVVTTEHGEEILSVVGRGVVTVFDGRNVVSNAHEARRTAPLLVSGARPARAAGRLGVQPDHQDPGRRTRSWTPPRRRSSRLRAAA